MNEENEEISQMEASALAEAQADSDDPKEEQLRGPFKASDEAEAQIDKEFQAIFLKKEGAMGFDAEDIAQLCKYVDDKINRKLTCALQTTMKTVLKKTIKFCDQRVKFLIEEQNEKIGQFEEYQDL